jgi:hypothetical protein
MGFKNKTSTAIGYCDVHRKLSYTDRKRARAVARQHTERKNVYRCTANEGMWHIGGLPEEVRHGHISKSEYFSNRRSA